MQPLVSVVVPVRNRKTLLVELLNGLDRQSLRDFEVIVVDDGSTDGSAELAATAEVAGRTVRVVRGPGHGAVSARLAGVAVAQGNYLAFTDSDCVPAPQWLAAGVAELANGAAVVNGRTLPARPVAPLERSVTSEDEGLFPSCNVFYERAAYDAVGGFDPSAGGRLGFRHDGRAKGLGFGEDTLLAWAVQRAGGRARYAPDAMVEHHVFDVDVSEAISRAWMVGAFPALIREVPQLRGVFVRRGVLFGERSRVPLYLLLAAALVRRRRCAVLAAGWWVGLRWRDMKHSPASTTAKLRALPVELTVDVVTAVGLAAGSARSGNPLL